MRDGALEPVLLPDEVWERPETVAALRERRIGYLFELARKYAGASQTRIANASGMDQAQVSRIMSGDRQTAAIDVLERVARGLSMPDHARITLGLAPHDPRPARPAATPAGLRRLPAPVTDLVGRDGDIDTVTGLLSSRRLITLVGAPGIGKTRLAIAVAEQVASRFAGGVVFIPLAETAHADGVTAAIARNLDITETAGRPLLTTLTDELRDRHLLLVLDNFEHLLDAAPQIAALLAATRRLHTLITSRERLRVTGEQVYPVPALTLPDRTETDVARLLAESSAVALFTTRAAATGNDFALTRGTIKPVIELCHRLDGLPLAIELAAARTATFTPDELRADLTQRLDLISDGPRDLPTRQQTLHAAIDWSHNLLAGDEQDLLARLSVFGAGCNAHAAHQVCTPDSTEYRTRTTLGALVDKSLVRATPDPEQRTHYQLLETIRVYAAAQLALHDQADAIQHRHAHYYETFATDAATELQGPDQAAWVGRIEREYPNLQGALAWALDHDHVHTAATIATHLEHFWSRGRDMADGRRWCDRILATPVAIPADLRVRVLVVAALLACWQSDAEAARALADRCIAEAWQIGDQLSAARAARLLAVTAVRAGDHDEAQTQYERCRDLFRDLGDGPGEAAALDGLGLVAYMRGDLDTAATHGIEGLRLYREAGDSVGVVVSIANLGEVRVWQGDAEAARPLLGEALTMSREIGERFVEAGALNCLGRLAHMAGDHAEARRLCVAALELRHEIGEYENIPESLLIIAGLAHADHPELAVRLLAAADALRDRLELPLPPLLQPVLAKLLAGVRTVLDGAAFAAQWGDGRTAPIETIIGQAVNWAAQDQTGGIRAHANGAGTQGTSRAPSTGRSG